MRPPVRYYGDGRLDLVFVHGWAFNDLVWETAVRGLGREYRCVLVNFPGTREPRSRVSQHSLPAYAEAVCQHVREDSVWVGWSLGGMVAMQAAVDYPAKVRGLSLVASTPRFTRAPDWPCGIPSAVLTDFARELESHPSRTLSRFIALQVRGASNAQKVKSELKRALVAGGRHDPLALRAGLRVLAESDLREQLYRLDCPVQLVLGERDLLVPPTVASWVGRLRPGWSFEMLAGAGHAPFLSSPAEYWRILEAFLRARV